MSTEPDEARLAVTSRRTLFVGAGAVGAGALLAACGNGDDVSEPGPPPETQDDRPGDGPETAPEDDGPDDGADGVLAQVDEIEVGGGVIVGSERVVITQPTEGDFRGFSAICTHMGCTVSSIGDGTINCACHGSQYSIEDGSVVRSAPELTPDTQNPLPEVDISVDGDRIIRA
jgi:Rieske Fe-S protein